MSREDGAVFLLTPGDALFVSEKARYEGMYCVCKPGKVSITGV